MNYPTFKNLQLGSGATYDNVQVRVSVYTDNGNASMHLLDPGSFEPIAVATVNMDVKLYGYDMHIKDWSENEGVFDWLVLQGIVQPAPEIDYFNGHVTAKGAVLDNDALIEQLEAIGAQWRDAEAGHFNI